MSISYQDKYETCRNPIERMQDVIKAYHAYKRYRTIKMCLLVTCGIERVSVAEHDEQQIHIFLSNIVCTTLGQMNVVNFERVFLERVNLKYPENMLIQAHW